MKRSTILGCFVGLLSLTLSAQTTQPLNSKTSSSPTSIEVQQKPTASIQELLTRYNDVGKYAGSIADHFSIEEQQMLRSYFSNLQPARAANTSNYVSLDSSEEARGIVVTEAQRAAYEEHTPLFVAPIFNSSAEAKNLAVSTENRTYNQTPLFVAQGRLTAEDEAELLAAGQERPNTNVAGDTRTQNRVLSDIVPTAGETETFTPDVGDNFFDPGGPGGANSDGEPGNYPNCNCDTQSTLAGVTEIEFLDFGVNGTFDYLRIYDGTDATGTVLYDNSSTGANSGDKTLADFIASNGSASITGTSGDLFFFFHASSVVNWLGWDAEIIAASGGGGSAYCIPEGTNSNRFIDNFSTTGGSENISNMGSGYSADGYGDFYDTDAVEQEQDGTIDFSVDIEGGTAGFRVWVDWNQDGVFDTTDEVAYSSSGYSVNHTGTITVPADAMEGDTRMRIVSHWLSTSGDVDPCATGFTYGEFEDYKFTVPSGGGSTVYCIPEGTNSSRFINNFSTTGGSENISNMGSGFSPDGYGDFYDTDTVTQEQEGTVDFSADMEGGTAGFRIWVDWNQDGVFDTTDEVAYSSSGYSANQTGTITVPADAMEGDTRMRVVSHWLSTSGDVDPCATGFTYGEFEDYKFTVTAGGGGDPGGACNQEFVIVGDGNGGSGSSVDSDFTSAADIVVAAGEDFTLDTIEVSFLTFAPEDAPITANVIYYEDAGGLPGAEIGTETVVPTILSSGEWVNPVAFRFDTQLDMTPFTFNGDAGSDTSYWIGVEMGTATNQATVFWLYTDGAGIEGEPMAQYNAVDDLWTVPEPTREVGYNFSGECTPMGGGSTACNQDHGVAGDANGGSGSSLDSDFKSAGDILVAAGEDFTIDTIEVPFLTFAPEDAPITAQVVYYENDSGLPGAQIGTETVVPTILSAQEWVNPVAWIFETQLDLTPFTFEGDENSDTTYWIEVSMGTATNQATVFWTYTDGAGLEGEPMAQYNAVDDLWTIPEPTREVIYNFSGECTPMGGGGCTPGSLETLYAAGNNGSPGGAVYFDLTVAGTDIEVSSFDLHTEDPGAFTVDVYMFEGSYVGNQADPSIWGAAEATGSGTSAGAGLPSTATLDNPIALSANTTYAVALVFDGTHSHYYTNGDGTNQNYSNADIALALGSASNTPFTTPIYDPRVFNGGVGYCVGSTGGGSGPLTTVYGINNANQDLIGFGVASPGNTEVFGTSPITANFENAGAIDPANPTTGYVLDNAGQFYSFDVESGFYTLLGNIPGDWIGMEFDRTSGTLYAIAGADLYTIDPVAISATLVGATGIDPASLPIALAIDGAGVGYTYELVDQMFYSIDLNTGTATMIGDIGFDANFGQGMCYDPTTDMVYMSAFNADTFTAEWRSVDLATGMTTLVGPIVTPAATTQVAWSSIGETLDPPTCPQPTNLAVSNITSTTVDLSWNEEPNASSGYIWYVFEAGDNPATDSPVATGTTPSGTTTATATGLSGGLSYDFYVVADCDSDGLSQFAGPVTFATPPACGGKFYDDGGPNGNYSNNANITTVISPDVSGEAVTVTFVSFDVESGWDALYVYDGPDASSPIISSGNPQTNGGFPAGGYYGTSIPGPFTSTHSSGALTFVFLSEGSVNYAGWEADVTCSPIGIDENLLESFSFYPNPTNGMLNLKSADNIENVTFYNVLGQMVITQRVNATASQVDISGLSAGTYLMEVTVNGQTGTYRVLKQ